MSQASGGPALEHGVDEAPPPEAKAAVRLAAVLALGAVALVLAARVTTWDDELAAVMRGQGAAAIMAFVAAYVVSAVALVPGSALTLGAGFVYGVGKGTLVVYPAAWLAAVIAFEIARRVARRAVHRRAARHRRFAALDAAIGRSGFTITLLLRLAPIVPYTLLNYTLGVTAVRWRDYASATALGMLPGTLLYVALGALAANAEELHRPKRWLLWAGGALTLAAFVGITAVARRALRAELQRGAA